MQCLFPMQEKQQFCISWLQLQAKVYIWIYKLRQVSLLLELNTNVSWLLDSLSTKVNLLTRKLFGEITANYDSASDIITNLKLPFRGC